MPITPGRPKRRARLARALGLERNPLLRASDRAEAWIRVGLLAVFLIAGPMTALAAGGWAHHAGTSVARVPPAQGSHVTVPGVVTQPAPVGDLAKARTVGQAWRSRSQDSAASARTAEVLAEVVTPALTALVLLAALWLTTTLLTRRRLAAWGTDWSRVGPQWSRGRP
jgi:hypothetical protein